MSSTFFEKDLRWVCLHAKREGRRGKMFFLVYAQGPSLKFPYEVFTFYTRHEAISLITKFTEREGYKRVQVNEFLSQHQSKKGIVPPMISTPSPLPNADYIEQLEHKLLELQKQVAKNKENIEVTQKVVRHIMPKPIGNSELTETEKEQKKKSTH